MSEKSELTYDQEVELIKKESYLLWCLIRDALENAYGSMKVWRKMALLTLIESLPGLFEKEYKHGYIKLSKAERKFLIDVTENTKGGAK